MACEKANGGRQCDEYPYPVEPSHGIIRLRACRRPRTETRKNAENKSNGDALKDGMSYLELQKLADAKE